MKKMYTELAEWWPLLSPPDEYQDEAEFFYQVLLNAGLPQQPAMLELGCGGGSNAFHLNPHFAQMTLTDLSPHMLAISQRINPNCEHIMGDMRLLRLDRTFDVVFIHDAIDYMTTLSDLRQAMETAFVHCKPGGLALFVPDHVRETFAETTDHGGSDGDTRGLRYLEWSYDPNTADTTCTVEYVYVLREIGQPTRVEHEQHINGLFARDEWLELLREIGFTSEIIHDEYQRELFVARRPAA